MVLAFLAKRLRIPYPIAFVVGGAGLAFMRHLPKPHIEPDLILLLILPPLLYSAAWSTDWLEMKRNARPISLLAIGLVVFTMVVVAVAVHAAVPGFDWPLAFTLGAIVSPPDAVASEAVFEHLAVPRRVAAVINGECLMNDATALVLYRFALAAAVTGVFSFARASVAFVVVAIGGVAIGVATALIVEGALRRISSVGYGDPMIASVVFLLAPFASYVPAEALHVSGVLAAVTAGILLSQRSSAFIDPETRVLGSSVWRLLTFVLNAFAFLLIGLELPGIFHELAPHVRDYFLDGLWIALVVIVVRIVWVFPATYVPRWISPKLRKRDPYPSWRGVAVLSWAGMRGIVSLAIALALPTTLGNAPFPQRNVAIFFTFCVVFVTLVLQGLTLGPLIEWLGVAETSRGNRLETQVRVRALEAGVARLREIEHSKPTAMEEEVLGRSLEEYQHRIDVLRGRASKEGDLQTKERRADRRLQREALAAERRAIAQMRKDGEIPDNVYRSIEYDLDLADLRLR